MTRVPRNSAPTPLRSLLLCCAIGACGASATGWSQSPDTLSTDIVPQPLSQALTAFADRTGLQLIYVSELANDRASKGARAGVALSEALGQLLSGTGLSFEFLNSRTVRIFAAATAAPSGRSIAPAQKVAPPERRADLEVTALEEIVVTASKRGEALGKVPISIGVWTYEAMEVSGAKNMAKIAALTPGVEFDSYPDQGPAIQTNIAIRGINSKDGSTTSVYLDDTPIPTDRASTFGRAFPLTFDLDRIEILRGPQGTLAGEGAEGGVVRFITKQPSLTTFSGLARFELATTVNGAQSYAAGAAGGGPLVADRVGYRLAASTETVGGYVDRVNPFTGATVDGNANRERRESVRAAIAIAPTESIWIVPAIYYQSVDVDDTSSFYTYLSDPDGGVLQNGKLIQQWAANRFYIPSLTIAATLGVADVVSTTAYVDRLAKAIVDGTNNSFWFWPNPLGPEYPVSYTNAKPGPVSLAQYVVSEELRVTSREPEAWLSWIAGASYLHAHYEEVQPIATAALADGGFVSGPAFATRFTEQIGGFAQLSFRVTNRITATAGLRVERATYNSRQGFDERSTSPNAFEVTADAMPTAPRFNLSYQADPENLYYATVAKGYRMGGPNALMGTACPTATPPSYGPDSVWNFELGAKNYLLGGRLRLDSSIFHARWDALQTQTPFPDCGFGYTTNAGAAVSQGVDLGAEALLTQRLKVALTAAYVDAHYTETVLLNGAVVVGRGDAIGVVPLVTAPWTVTATADYRFPPGEGFTVALHAQDAFHSQNPGPFTSDNPDALVYAPARRPNPATNQLDLRATASWRSVDVAVFVNNVLNSQPTLQRRNYIARDTLFYATTLRPRTVGVNVNWRF